MVCACSSCVAELARTEMRGTAREERRPSAACPLPNPAAAEMLKAEAEGAACCCCCPSAAAAVAAPPKALNPSTAAAEGEDDRADDTVTAAAASRIRRVAGEEVEVSLTRIARPCMGLLS